MEVLLYGPTEETLREEKTRTRVKVNHGGWSGVCVCVCLEVGWWGGVRCFIFAFIKYVILAAVIM